VASLYKQYICNVTLHLASRAAAAAGRQGSAQQAQSQALALEVMSEMSAFVERVSMYCPAHIKRVLCCNLETLAPATGEPRRLGVGQYS
jgi:hypothetical protein